MSNATFVFLHLLLHQVIHNTLIKPLLKANSNHFYCTWLLMVYRLSIDHVTSNISFMFIIANYKGVKQLLVGNDESTNITHIGHVLVLSSFHSKTLYLKNVLCILYIIKNLLSISKLLGIIMQLVNFELINVLLREGHSSNPSFRENSIWSLSTYYTYF